ncbi:CAF1-domain-containing protein [Hyaloscypha hepaticicola]|uniref:CAF1-domain-containing protein n=1 Tax=Hyaloscypha hepaticicola TaxID=2082293 RepID=A0A2J6PZL5_9HELO|nr:CAF1-domain-containing protein [Hyaloscypha hepaticicola]
MEVDQERFRKELLPILRNIANAAFVAIDLEMSGISTRPKFSSGDRSHDVGKSTLEQQYQEMKSAAEIFQVLQIGITCVEVDPEKEFYLARPYNFNVTPLSVDAAEEKKVGDLRLERVFSFSSISSGFLHSKKFDFGKVFTHGIPYLSRDEEAACREEYNQRADIFAKLPYIPIRLDEPNTLAFYRRARRTIRDWLRNPTPGAPTVNVGNPDGPLNGYQRRLVYQLIRDEFPALKCMPRNDGAFMQVRVLDHEKEAQYQAKKLIEHNDKIAKQKGLTWIFEALVGGDLSGIQPEWFASTSSDKLEDQLPYIKVELAQIIAILQKKKHILVGHNVFTDLGFLYKTFIGKLPATVKNFQAEIHELFPTIFDTKYLLTHDNDSMNPRADLKDLLAPFRKVHVPLVVLHEDHTAYGAPLGKEHEAGFDSWMTAELFVKSSAKLFSTSSRRVRATKMPAYVSDAESSSSIYGSTQKVRGNLSFEKYPSKSVGPSISYDEAKGYYSDEEDDDPDGGALIDLRSATPSPKKINRPLGALNGGVKPFFPTSFQNQSNTSARLGSFINGFNHAGSFNAGSFNAGSFNAGSFNAGSLNASYFNAGLLSGHTTSSPAKGNVNAYPGSSSFMPTLPLNPQAGYFGTFHTGNFWNGPLSATPMSPYPTVATGTGVSGGGALVNAQDYFGSAMIQAPVPWQGTALKRPSLTPAQAPTYFPPTIMQDNLPPSYHARQLNASAIALQGNDAETDAAQQEAAVQPFIPPFQHPCWRRFANKLRVYGVEGGLCKLA